MFSDNCIFIITLDHKKDKSKAARLLVKNAIFIENLSYMPNESEVMLPSGVEFIIEKINYNQNFYEVFLKIDVF